MPRSLLSAALALALFRSAQAAAPALEFFDEVDAAIAEYYYAPPGVDAAAAMKAARAALVAQCAPQGENCALDVGAEAARTAIAGFKDPHAHLDLVPPPPPASSSAGNPAPAPAAPRGPMAPVNPLGWMLRTFGKDGPLYVAWVAPGGPAERAGLRRHDLLVAPAGLPANALNSLAEPTAVKWTRGGESFEATLTPDAALRGPMPRLTMLGDVGVLQFPHGASTGAGEAAHALVREAQSKQAAGLLLDLRDNPGGGIECAAMASAFLAYSTDMRDRQGSTRRLTVAPGGARMVEGEDVEELKVAAPAHWEGPLAILVNKNTGSCAESVAIEAKMAHRATIVGEDSVGVGNNVVRPFPLPSGYRMVLPVAYAFTPKGEALPRRPAPDVVVADDVPAIGAGGDAVLEAGIAALRAK